MRSLTCLGFLLPLAAAAVGTGCFLDRNGLGPEFSTAQDDDAGSDASPPLVTDAAVDVAVQADASLADRAADSTTDVAVFPDAAVSSDAPHDAPSVVPGVDGSGEASSTDASVEDASVDASSDASLADVVAAPDGGGIPVGWEAVLLASASAPVPSCPAGFPSHDVFGAFQTSPSACSCSCAMTTQPDCTTGTLETMFGAGKDCRQDGTSLDVTGGACLAINASLGGRFFEGTPLPPTGGACTSSAMLDETKVTKSPVRYCSEPPTTAPAAGGAAAPAGFVACITAPGQQACPTGSAFVHPQLVEDDVAVTCSACGACTFVASCSNGSLSVFQGMGCTTDSLLATLTVDGTCQDTGAGSGRTDINFLSYTAQATATCSSSGTSTPTASPTNTRTVCCP